MNFEKLYIFDFDDTLFWAPEWYGETRLDRDGFVTSWGNSQSLFYATVTLSTLSSIVSTTTKKTFRLKAAKKYQPNGRHIFFLVTDKVGNPVEFDELKKYDTGNYLENSHIGVNLKYSPFASVTEDNDFYRSPNTVGCSGINEEIFNLYRMHQNSIILTARKNVMAMHKAIESAFEEHCEPVPQKIYLQPEDSKSSGEYKAKVILDILSEAAQHPNSEIFFYDDNIKYIEKIEEHINEFDKINGTNLRDIITINHVSNKNKPLSRFELAMATGEILGKDYFLRRSGFVDKFVEKIYSDSENEK